MAPSVDRGGRYFSMTIVAKPTGGTIIRNGIACGTEGSACSARQPAARPVQLIARPDVGFVFLRLTGDCDASGATRMGGPGSCGDVFESKGGTQLAAGGQPAATPPAASPATPPPGVSPQRMYELPWVDYIGAEYNLAIVGLENYIRIYPRSEQAGDAQYFIGESYYHQGMFREAAAAFDRGTADYPNSERVPDTYWKRGMAQNALGQTDRTRESWEFVVKTFPNSDAGRLARQRLDQMISKHPGDTEDEQCGSDWWQWLVGYGQSPVGHACGRDRPITALETPVAGSILGPSP